MSTEDKLTLHDAHLKFAKEANGKAWQLLEKPDRSPAEDDELLEAVYASNYHWRSMGTRGQRAARRMDAGSRILDPARGQAGAQARPALPRPDP